MWATRTIRVVWARLALGLGVLASPAFGANGAPQPIADTIAGTIVDPAGKPAAGAMVWLVGGPYDDDANSLEKTVADAQGRFAFATAKAYIRPNWRMPHVVAKDSQGRLGGDSFPWAWPRWTARQNIRVELLEVRDYRGRIENAAGQPIAKALVRLKTIYTGSIHGEASAGIELGAELSGQSSCECTADGSFTLRGVPTSGSVSGRVTAAGFGSPGVSWDVDAPVTLRLRRAGNIRGLLATPGNVPLRDALKIQLYGGGSRSDNSKKAAFRVFYHATAFSQKDGAFRFDDVPPGAATITPDLYESRLPYYVKAPAPLEVKPGETASLKVTLLQGIAVRGRVIDGKTEKGIGGVELWASQMSGEGRQEGSRKAVTEADGRFVAYLPPGKVRVEVGEAPDDYVPPLHVGDYRSPQASYFPTLDAAKDIVWPTIRLDRAARLEGVVVDEAGKPVADAEVECLASRGPRASQEVTAKRTAADGTFTIKGLYAKEVLAIRARTERAVSGVVELRPADAAAPLRLTLSEARVFVIRGTCVDTAGRPIRRAQVTVSGVWMLGPSGLSFAGGHCETDAEGRFEVHNLWPGFQYQVLVTAKGYEKAETARLNSQPGQTGDVGRLTLVGVNGSVEGIVTDSAGRPLAGVRVFNSGDAPKVLSTSTDAAGRFTLKGFRLGPVYVFAEKDGYRFAAVSTQANSTGVKLRLLHNDKAVPPWKPARPPASPAEEQKVARRLLERLWTAPGGKSRWAIEYMARIETQQAMKWSNELGGGNNGLVRKIAAEQIAESDAEEALSLLSQCGDRDAYFSLTSLAERFAACDREKAQRFAEEAIQRARRLDQPDRAWALAGTSQVVARLGNVAAGKKLAEEAAVAAAKMGTDERQTYYRGLVATALAPHDLAAAMRLVQPGTDVYASGRSNEKERALARLATVIAVQNLDKALQIVGRLDKNSTQRDNTRMQIAYNLAPTRPQDALRVIEGMDAYGATKIKAEAYGWMATAVASRNPQLARSLIEKGMAVYWQRADEFRSWSNYGGRSGFAAFLTVQAKEIGYPELGLLVNRVLAMRPVSDSWSSPQDIRQTSILTARLLALVDPHSAKQMLLTAAPSDQTPGGVRAALEDRALLSAWALADLDHAARLIESWIEMCKEGNVWLDSVNKAMDVLTTPPAERARCMLRFEGYWFPGED
jgi:protocatechuate 3,4-dioxygenase beta subunit